MTLYGIHDVDPVDVWEGITKTFIEEYLNQIEWFEGGVEVVIAYVGNEVSDAQRRGRLQVTEEIWTQFSFNIDVFYRTKLATLDIGKLLEDSFRTRTSKFNYVEALRSGSVDFFSDASIDGFQIIFPFSNTGDNQSGEIDDDVVLPENKNENSNESQSSTTKGLSDNEKIGIIVGSTAAGLMLITLAVLGYTATPNLGVNDNTLKYDTSAIESSNNHNLRQATGYDLYAVTNSEVELGIISRIIDVKMNSSESVSNLEDPSIDPNLSLISVEDSQSTRSFLVSERSDVLGGSFNSQVFGDASQTLESSIVSIQDALEGNIVNFPFQPNKSPEISDRRNLRSLNDFYEVESQQHPDSVEITIPAGKIGIVVDSPDSGPPMIHAIKPTSILSGIVKEGDRIVGFNKEDTSKLTAMQLTHLIIESSDKNDRNLVIRRINRNSFCSQFGQSEQHQYEDPEIRELCNLERAEKLRNTRSVPLLSVLDDSVTEFEESLALHCPRRIR